MRISGAVTAAVVAGSVGFGVASGINAGSADAGPATDRATLSELREISKELKTLRKDVAGPYGSGGLVLLLRNIAGNTKVVCEQYSSFSCQGAFDR